MFAAGEPRDGRQRLRPAPGQHHVGRQRHLLVQGPVVVVEPDDGDRLEQVGPGQTVPTFDSASTASSLSMPVGSGKASFIEANVLGQQPGHQREHRQRGDVSGHPHGRQAVRLGGQIIAALGHKAVETGQVGRRDSVPAVAADCRGCSQADRNIAPSSRAVRGSRSSRPPKSSNKANSRSTGVAASHARFDCRASISGASVSLAGSMPARVIRRTVNISELPMLLIWMLTRPHGKHSDQAVTLDNLESYSERQLICNSPSIRSRFAHGSRKLRQLAIEKIRRRGDQAAVSGIQPNSG